jgi:hypothetical protein
MRHDGGCEGNRERDGPQHPEDAPRLTAEAKV